MRKRDFAKLSNKLLPQMTGFSTNGAELLFMVPIGHTLRGFLFESSSYTKEDFYIWCFFLPLCFPAEEVSLTYGERLIAPDGTKGWSTKMHDLIQALSSAIFPHLGQLAKLKSERDVALAIESRSRSADGLYESERIAYLYILAGEFQQARERLEALNQRSGPKYAWEQRILERASLIKSQLNVDPALAIKQIENWRDEALTNLQLQAWR